MTKKYHDEIYSLIQTNGPMGVNELQKELNIPLSTLQHYLTKQQNFFKKNENRKWDLPENIQNEVKTNVLELMVNGAENAVLLLQSQVSEIQLSIENVLTTVNTVKRGITNLSIPPVADKSDKSSNIHPRATKMMENATLIEKAIKQHISKIPEEYVEILKNVDWIELSLDMGSIYFQNTLGPEITQLIVGDADTLTEETLITLEKYQKGE